MMPSRDRHDLPDPIDSAAEGAFIAKDPGPYPEPDSPVPGRVAREQIWEAGRAQLASFDETVPVTDRVRRLLRASRGLTQVLEFVAALKLDLEDRARRLGSEDSDAGGGSPP